MNLGTIAMHQGRFRDADRYFDDALQSYYDLHDPVRVAKVQCNRAELCRREDRPQEALPVLLAARDVFRAAAARYDHALVENDLGCIYLSMHAWDPALRAFKAAVDEFEQIGSLSGKAWVLSNIAELYVATEQWEKAEPSLDEAYRLATMCGRQIVAAAVDVDRGRMLVMRGDYAGARRVWERALRVQESKAAILAAQQTRRLIEELPREYSRAADA
jgi:tetratricopeptide (TPR) repeat protein